MYLSTLSPFPVTWIGVGNKVKCLFKAVCYAWAVTSGEFGIGEVGGNYGGALIAVPLVDDVCDWEVMHCVNHAAFRFAAQVIKEHCFAGTYIAVEDQAKAFALVDPLGSKVNFCKGIAVGKSLLATSL
ncbi:MAG: hypothetical protein E7122_04575 [Bacteroidales bacterium]|nr:hypothetical protein [Bacteroidales bacterium]